MLPLGHAAAAHDKCDVLRSLHVSTCNLVRAWGDIGHGGELSLMRNTAGMAILHFLVSERF